MTKNYPTTQKHGVGTCTNRLHRETNAVWEGQYSGSKQMSVEKLGMELEILRLHVRENDDIVLIKNLLVFPGRHVVKFPRWYTDDFVSSAGLNSRYQPFSIIYKIQSLGGVIK